MRHFSNLEPATEQEHMVDSQLEALSIVRFQLEGLSVANYAAINHAAGRVAGCKSADASSYCHGRRIPQG